MTISPFDWAEDGAAVSRLLAASISAVAIVRYRFMVLFSLLAYSVRERPDTEVAPDVPPQAVQALRLHDEEEDDEGAEQHEAKGRNQVQDGLRSEERRVGKECRSRWS